MILIAAMGPGRVIGSGAGMPWSVPEEYAQFLAHVEGHSVVMGRRSFEIFGADLGATRNIVITRSGRSFPRAVTAPGLDAALTLARSWGKTIFCAGGASVYAQALGQASAMYLSFIKGVYEGDAFFPAWDPAAWSEERREDHARYEFVIFRRRPDEAGIMRGHTGGVACGRAPRQ